ncbi:MAG: hypothetical protein GY898_26215 [Proteobacteria bacterium]|nr:hypothetical protein [Pseudomonadota bacterium]
MHRLAPLLFVPLLLIACEPEVDPVDVFIDEACEWSNPVECMLPFPSNRWLQDGHLQYDAAVMPTNLNDEAFDPAPYARFDGFPPASHMLTMFPKAVDVGNLAWIEEYGESLLEDSPTVIVDLTTGERIAHFAEIDTRAGEDFGAIVTDPPTLLYLHPAQRLQEGRTYGVALRDIWLVDGTQAVATRPFEVLRDNVPTTSDVVEAARPRYEALFEGLTAAGVAREDLVQAWSFTTATGDSIKGDLLAMRADFLERVPEGSGECTVTSSTDAPDGRTARRVEGTFKAPLYLDADATGARVVRGADDLPEFQGWADVPFVVNIPNSVAATGEARMVQFGHGLMGSAAHEMQDGFVTKFAQDYSSVLVGTDWQGMSRDDLTTVAAALSDIQQFSKVSDRLMQGMVGEWALTRAFQGTCRTMDAFAADDGSPAIGSGEPYFIGISQGGILGGTFMATSPDIERGTLVVGSMDFPFTMTRSLNWVDYELIFRAWYDRRIDRELLVYVMASLWDQAEPNAYIPGITSEKKILFQVAEGDLQVQTIAADRAIRTMGIPLLAPALRPVWGVEEVEGPLDSAYVYYDLLAPLPPMENQLPEPINNVHNQQRGLTAAQEQMDAFFRPDGQITNFCDGVCDPQ